MKKTVLFAIFVFTLCTALASCVMGTISEFTSGPALALQQTGSSLVYTRGHSDPRADTYDLYWIKGDCSQAEILAQGNLSADVPLVGTIDVSLKDGDTVSAIVAANLKEYKTAYSPVRKITFSQSAPAAPVLTLYPSPGMLDCVWIASIPPADSYDLYWIAGSVSDAAAIMADGTKITGVSSPYEINGLINDNVYSVLVTANTGAARGSPDTVVSLAKQGTPGTPVFITAPVLTVAPNPEALVCGWTASDPAAESYDLYWIQGNVSDPAQIKNGTKVSAGTALTCTISGLTDDVTYSVLVSAGRTGYISVDSAVKTGAPSVFSFSSAPGLSLIPEYQGIYCFWPPADPWAASYDIYYRAGTYTNPADVKAGTKISNVDFDYGQRISGLTNGAVYSVLVSANRDGFISADSQIRTAVPAAGLAKSKRGVGYGFGTSNGGNAAQDMAMLAPGVSWFYNWGNSITTTIENLAIQNNVVFIPMAWNALSASSASTIKTYLARHPEVEYILAYNEPMFTDQANMTPAQAAANWPVIKQLAADCNLKIVGPALNYGQMMGPQEWFDQFIQQPGVSLSDMHAIALHCYMNYPSANKWYAVEQFAQYGLPIWMTEFCAWNSPSNIPDATWQEKFMSEIIAYYEQDPRVEKYAWFIPRSGSAGTNNTGLPYNALFAGGNLSRLGEIFLNMSFCDKSIWIPSGETIKAAQFTANHLSEWITKTGWPDSSYGSFPDTGSSVHFRPTTDAGGQVLDIYDFTNNNWVEYQVNLTSTGDHALTVRYQTAASTNMDIFVDNMTSRVATATLNSGSWTNASVDLGVLSAGQHTIRLKVTNSSGNCAINWLKVD